MKTRVRYTKIGLAALAAVLVLVLAFWAFSGSHFAVLSPKGPIAGQQRDLMIIATLLMLLVVIPVFILTAHIAWKYRAGNTKATYMPEWSSNRKLEALWWGLPGLIILTLSIIIWQTSHSLDPYRPIASNKPPLTIQVVALQWKWLFIYPEQDIATVNYFQMPVGRPVNFEITADAPMNSFWLPELGGQVYAMAGMTTKLHLMADTAGTYTGSSANLSGEGFSRMRFVAAATPDADFDAWVGSIKQTSPRLNRSMYDSLAKPSEAHIMNTYAAAQAGLYDTIIGKYGPPDAADGGHGVHGKPPAGQHKLRATESGDSGNTYDNHKDGNH